MTKTRCTGHTKAGKACSRWAVEGKDRCSSHPRKGGRPRREITADEIDALAALLKIGVPIEAAARQVEIPSTTITDRLERGAQPNAIDEDREFFEVIDAALKHPRDVALESVLKAAADGDWRAGAWILERTDPANYAKPSVRAPQPPRRRDPESDDPELPENVIKLHAGEGNGHNSADW